MINLPSLNNPLGLVPTPPTAGARELSVMRKEMEEARANAANANNAMQFMKQRVESLLQENSDLRRRLDTLEADVRDAFRAINQIGEMLGN